MMVIKFEGTRKSFVTSFWSENKNFLKDRIIWAIKPIVIMSYNIGLRDEIRLSGYFDDSSCNRVELSINHKLLDVGMLEVFHSDVCYPSSKFLIEHLIKNDRTIFFTKEIYEFIDYHPMIKREIQKGWKEGNLNIFNDSEMFRIYRMHKGYDS